MVFSSRTLAIKPSATLALVSKVGQLKKLGKSVISFGAGEPDFDTPEYIKSAAIKAIEGGFTKYTASGGMPELKEAICAKFKADNGLVYEPKHIVVSCGAKHALYNIFQALCNDADEVIIPAPFWVSYPEIVKVSGAVPVFVNTKEANGFKLTKEELLSAISPKTKALIINSPSNPTGCVYSKDELQAIAEICVQRGIWVISDEIYEKIIYDGLKHYSIAGLSKSIYDLTVVVNGVSKSYSMTGWRIGYLAGPVEIVKLIDALQSHSTSNPSSISQKASLAALMIDDGSVKNMAVQFQKRRDVMLEMFKNINGITAFKPGGAFYLFCDISKLGMDSGKFSERLLDEKLVAVVPGKEFGYDNYIRLSFATSMENIKEGLNRIGDFTKSL